MEREKLFSQLELSDIAGQVLCYDVYDKDDPAEVEKVLAEIHPGALYLDNMSYEKIQMYTEMANKYVRIPVAIVADVECGPGENMQGLPVMPNAMAWGACDRPELIEEAQELTAKMCRLQGIHWALAPVADINFNFNNPLVGTRAVSDSPTQVLKMVKAFVRGLQKNGYMAATLKHFPGDGVDDRNQHFCTTVNSLSKEEWNSSYGKVYRECIKDGVASVMCAHIAYPAYAGERDEFGEVPSVLSKPLMTDLLKGELGFDGCIISDAMAMVGTAGRCNLDELALNFINCGGDMVLFNEPEDHERLLSALNSGVLKRERLLDAVKRVIRVKKQVRLFEDQSIIEKEIGETQEQLIEKFNKVSDEIAVRSIKTERNYRNILHIRTNEKLKFLCVDVKDNDKIDSSFIAEELKKRGHEVFVAKNMGHSQLAELSKQYDYVLVNYFFTGAHGGSNRAGWNHINHFWRGYLLKHPRVIFTAFGDPYKLYEYSFLQTYINAFSYTEPSQRAFVKILLGEKKETAKNPITLKGYFTRETD